MFLFFPSNWFFIFLKIFELKLQISFMTKAVSNRDMCLRRMAQSPPPLLQTIQLGLILIPVRMWRAKDLDVIPDPPYCTLMQTHRIQIQVDKQRRSGTGYIGLETEYVGPGTGYICLGTGYVGPGTGYVGPGTGYVGPGTGLHKKSRFSEYIPLLALDQQPGLRTRIQIDRIRF